MWAEPLWAWAGQLLDRTVSALQADPWTPPPAYFLPALCLLLAFSVGLGLSASPASPSPDLSLSLKPLCILLGLSLSSASDQLFIWPVSLLHALCLSIPLAWPFSHWPGYTTPFPHLSVLLPIASLPVCFSVYPLD